MIEEYQTTEEITDGLLTLFDECESIQQPGKVSIQDDKHQGYGKNVEDPLIKKCTDLFWSDIPKAGIKSHPRFKDQEYMKHINECAHDYSNKYLKGHQLTLYGNPKYQYYKPGEAFYGEHFDALNSTQIRVVAYITLEGVAEPCDPSEVAFRTESDLSSTKTGATCTNWKDRSQFRNTEPVFLAVNDCS